MTSSFSSQSVVTQAPRSSAIYADRAVNSCAEIPCAPVGKVLRDLSAEELESHIESCGLLMLAAYARYEASGCFSDKGDADRWMRTQAEAIKARSPAQVAQLEQERGIA
jgi:hypothetical protein